MHCVIAVHKQTCIILRMLLGVIEPANGCSKAAKDYINNTCIVISSVGLMLYLYSADMWLAIV